MRPRTFSTVLLLSVAALVCAALTAPAPSRATTSTTKGSKTTNSGYPSQDIAISTASVLLPPDPNVAFEIDAVNGCFTWQEKRESQLLIIEEVESCGHRIKVSVSPERKSAPASAKAVGAPDRLSTLLHATDTNTGRVLRCEVFIDSIARIEILTTARSLYRDDLQEVQVQAFDSQGNIFSSVEGLEFVWSLESEVASDAGKTILKRMPFKDSGYEASQKLLAFESAGKETSIILLQAMEVGRVKVSAKLAEITSVPAHTVSMSVIEPLELSPLKELYVAPFTLFTYKLMTYQHRQQKQIDMPNSQYVWSSSDTTIAQVKSDGRVTTGSKLGYSVIKVEHKNMEDSVAKGGVNVVQPTRLSFRLRPSAYRDESSANTRYLVHERSYLLEVDVYDSDNHRMDQFEGSMEFDLQLDNQHVRVVKKEAANLWTVVGVKQGVSPISVTLTRVGHPSLGTATPDQQLKTQQDVEITLPVRLNKEKLVLPVAHSYQLLATGGSGSYNWASNATAAVTVSGSGFLSVVLQEAPQVPVTSTVFVSDERDPVFNRASLPVTVASPSSINFGNGPREAELNSELLLPLALSHNAAVVFDNCSGLVMAVNSSAAEIFSTSSALVACPDTLVGCACVSLTALKEGQTRLTASVVGIQLVAATPVAAFRPLSVSPQRILVTLESSFDIVVSGGPQPWQYQQVITPVVTPVESTTDNSVSIAPVFLTSGEDASGASWSFRLTCHSLGSQKVSVAVANPSSATNPQPFVATKIVSFDCAEPKHVFVSPVIAAQTADAPLEPGVLQTHFTEGQTACSETDTKLKDLHELLVSLGSDSLAADPFSVLPTRYKLRNSRLVLFQVALLDGSGRVFDNFSSLAVEWRSTNTSLISLGPTSELNQVKTHRLARMAEKEGTAAIRVSVSGYDKAAITGVAAAITRPAWTQPVSRDFDVTLVHNVRLIPPKLSLYNHPDNKVRIFAVGGSGYSQIQLNDTAVAAVAHQLGSGEISVAPKANGILKITVVDVCLAGSDPAQGIVHVSNVAAIRIKARDMLKIGDQMPVQVDLLDSYGAPFDASQLKWVDIKIHVDGSALDVVQITSATNHYTATGRHLGVSTISVSAVDPVTGATVSSAPLQVHIFPPFHVSPSKLELMPGAQFQLAVSGGPPFRSEISFEIANETIATVTKDGFVSAQPLVQSGRTTITVSIWSRVSGGDSQEKPQRAGTAVVDVEVHHLRGIRIQSSSPRLLLGEETSLRVEGLDGENPFAWGGLDVNFKWEVVNPDVVALAPIFESANVTLDEEHGFTVRVRGLKPGTTRISVRVTAGPASLTGKTSSMFLEIIPPLTLSGPGRRWEASSQDLLLLAPSATYVLVPNMANAVIKYSVVSDVPCTTTSEEVSIIKLEERPNSNSVHLQSTGLAGQTIVHAKDRTDGQVSIVKVAVKPVYHVELRPRVLPSAIPSTHPLLGQQASSYRFPVGNVVDFDLILRDELGQEFDGFLGQSSSVLFDAVVNRPDLVSVEIIRSSNTSMSMQDVDSVSSETAASAIVVRVRGLRPGRATIMVRLTQPSTIASSTTPEGNLQFYQLIRVANAILPMRPVVHVGGSVTFNTTFARDRSYKHVWSSSNDAVISIDSENGVAQALATGSANIYHNSSVYTVTQARVVKVAVVDADASDCSASLSASVASATEGSQSCVIPLRCKDADGALLADIDDFNGNAIVRQNMAVNCIISHPNVISTFPTTATLDSGVSIPACGLRWSSSVGLRGAAVKITATVADKRKSYRATSDDVPIHISSVSPSVTRFVIQGSPLTQLTASQPSVKYTISSSRDVVARVRDSHDSRRVSVKELPESNPSVKAFEISVAGSAALSEPAVVEFSDPLTLQSETVSILFSGSDPIEEAKIRQQIKEQEEQQRVPEAPPAPVTTPVSHLDFSLVVLGILAIAGAAIGMYILFWNRKMSAPLAPPRPSGSAFKTPIASTPARTPASSRFSEAASPYMSIHKPREQYLPPASPSPQTPYKPRM